MIPEWWSDLFLKLCMSGFTWLFLNTKPVEQIDLDRDEEWQQVDVEFEMDRHHDHLNRKKGRLDE